MNVINDINGLRTMMPPQNNPASPGPQREPEHVNEQEPDADTVDLSAEGAALAKSEDGGPSDGERLARIARIRTEIQNGTYDLNGKLDAAIDRLLEDL